MAKSLAIEATYASTSSATPARNPGHAACAQVGLARRVNGKGELSFEELFKKCLKMIFFHRAGYLTVHLATHSKTKAFSCDTCGSQFNRHYSLVKHKVIHTGRCIAYYSRCANTIHNPQVMFHFALSGERHYACEVCKMRYKGIGLLLFKKNASSLPILLHFSLSLGSRRRTT